MEEPIGACADKDDDVFAELYQESLLPRSTGRREESGRAVDLQEEVPRKRPREDSRDTGSIFDPDSGKDDKKHCVQSLKDSDHGVPHVFKDPPSFSRPELFQEDQRLKVLGSQFSKNLLEMSVGEPSPREARCSDASFKPSTIRIVITPDPRDEDEKLSFDPFGTGVESLGRSSSGIPEVSKLFLPSPTSGVSGSDLFASGAGDDGAADACDQDWRVKDLQGDSRILQGSDSKSHEEPEQPWMNSSLDKSQESLSAGDMEEDGMKDSPGARSRRHQTTMQDILSEIPSAVETSHTMRSRLIPQHHCRPDESEVCLVRLTQKVLVCRYQPAQLDVAAIAGQLQEAEELRSCVEQQVARMQSSQPVMEELRSAALTDASATVQVKAAQLDQVKHFHQQLRTIKAVLDVISEEQQTTLLGSAMKAEQAEKLQVLRRAVESKKEMLEELRHLGGLLSIHLTCSESSGALFAQVGDVEEKWRCLEESLKRDLCRTLNSIFHVARLVSQVKLLQDEVKKTRDSVAEPRDVGGCVDLAVIAGDVKLHQVQYSHFRSQADALECFSSSEKDEVEQMLQELDSTLSSTSYTLHSVLPSSQLSKQLRDSIQWLKQAEVQIWTGRTLSLFPDEARFQIMRMKKLQEDVSSRRSKMEVELNNSDDFGKVSPVLADMFDGGARNVGLVLDTMKKGLQKRETLLCRLAGVDAWLAEAFARRRSHSDLEDVSKQPTVELTVKLEAHTLASREIQSRISLVEELEEDLKKWAAGLSVEESRYLVNRLSGLWVELDRMLGYEKATMWELDELIHEKSTSEKELASLEESLTEISYRLEQQKFPDAQQTHLAGLKHQLMELQCRVQEIRHCQEGQRSSLLCVVGDLQDRCKALSVHASEQERYLHLRRRMESSRDLTKDQARRSKDKWVSVGERFRMCQALLVELPSVKTLCQEVADQLEAVCQELDPLDLHSERQRIKCTVDALVIREVSATEDIKALEAKLLLGLRHASELPSLTRFLRETGDELRGSAPVGPDEDAIDAALERCWILWRNVDSGMRVLEALARKQKLKRSDFGELYMLRDAALQECRGRMESLSQARESLKDYQWAARGTISFLHNAETTFLSAHGGFLDCTQEQAETRKALEVLEEEFRSHICHLDQLVPGHPCLSGEETQQLHIGVLSQLLVGRAVLEAQAQLRLESLQRCKIHQDHHKSSHQEMKQSLSGFEVRLSDRAEEHVTSLEEASVQHASVQVLVKDLGNLAGKIEDLKPGCPVLGCGVGKDLELGVLWRHWVFLRRHVSVLKARTDQRLEEWKDIHKTMDQIRSSLSRLQSNLPDPSTVRSSEENPQKVLEEAEQRQRRLEHEERAAASLQHRLERASCGHHDPGPVVHALEKIQEDIRSLRVRNMLVAAAAGAEQEERRQMEEKLVQVLRRVESQDSSNAQEIREERAELKSIMDSARSRYRGLPSEIDRLATTLDRSLQRAEDEMLLRSGPVRELVSRVEDLGSGLEKVKTLLELKSSSVAVAQKALKHVWDELDTWHNRLTLLESDAQDLVEDQPEQAQLFMDQLTRPLQLYQDVAKMAERRTNFLGKIPAWLLQFEDQRHSAACWLDEAQSWISAPSSFTSARSLQNYANALQLVLEDSERIRDKFQDFRPVLAEVSAVCDITDQETGLEQDVQLVRTMQSNILEPLELLQQAALEVGTMEMELKTLERNIPKIQAILESVENPGIRASKHLNNRQVILANLQSMRRTLEEMQRCRAELRLPPRARESLQVFSRVEVLLQTLTGLQQLTQQQVALLQNKTTEETQEREASSGRSLDALVEADEEEVDEDDRSSDTLTCSPPEDPEETFCAGEDEAAMKMVSVVKESKETEGQDVTEVKAPHDDVVLDTDLSEATRHTEDPVEPTAELNRPDEVAEIDDAPTSHFLSEQEVADQRDTTSLDSSSDPGPGTEGLSESSAEMTRASTSDRTVHLDLKDSPCDGPPAEEWTGDDQCSLSSWICGLSLGHTSEPLQSPTHLSSQLEVDSEEEQGPEEKALLLETSQSLLQGVLNLLDLSEDRAEQKIYSRSHLLAAVCRHKKLQKVLASQLAFVQHLVQREPDLLRVQEEALAQVKVRLGALQEEEVASERKLQDWTRWEDDCQRLNCVLDELEVVVNAEDPEKDDEEEAVRRHRLQSCQQALLQLEESRAALGLILDQRGRLQAEPSFGSSARQAGGALELRWRRLRRWLEQEVKRCRDIKDSQTRFLSLSDSVSEFLLKARKHLVLTSDLDQHSVCRSLILLLDLSSEMNTKDVQKAAASRDAARALALRDTDAPSLRRWRDQLEEDWSQLTSDLSHTQEQLQQRLLLSWPPLELLAHLEVWIQKTSDRLRESSLAEDEAEIRTSLQKLKESRAGLVGVQLLLDFLTQPGPQVSGEDGQSSRSVRTTFAERVGDVRMTWLNQRRDVEQQICRLELILHTCWDAEKQLQRLQRFLDEQEKLLSRRKRPHSRSQARRDLQNWEVEVGGLVKVSAELQQLETTLCVKPRRGRTETLRGSCDRLMEQMKLLKTSLQQTTHDWEQFEESQREVYLLTTRLRCSLQKLTEAPLLSLRQTDQLLKCLQGLQEQSAEGEGQWEVTLGSFQELQSSLDQNVAQHLSSDLNEEHRRWSETQQKLNRDVRRTSDVLSLWQEHNHCSVICRNHLMQLSDQWRALSDCERSTEEGLPSLEASTDELQNSLDRALTSSRSLEQRLDPLGAGLIQSESRLLSRDVSRLIQRASDRKTRSLEELRSVRDLESQMEKILLDHQTNHDSTKQQILQLSGLLPSLLHLQDLPLSVHQTLHALSGRWSSSVTLLCDTYRELQTESLSSLEFPHKCRALQSITEKIHHMVSSRRDANIQDVVAEHHELGLELMTGELLLRLLHRRVAEDERSELMSLTNAWTRCEVAALQHHKRVKQQLDHWRRCRHIRRLLQEVDSALPPVGPEQMTLQQLLTGVDRYQGAADALARHSGALSVTLPVGRGVCEAELQELQDAWSRTSRRLEQRSVQIRSAAQKWTEFQTSVSSVGSELDELKTTLTSQESEEEKLVQDSEISLHLLSCGLRDAGGLKADLTGYMMTGDSALLEQQLEQLHGQWEELCLKVSSRKQEIADRLSAWTIFNDKNKEFCEWLTQMENKACHRGDLSVEEMVEKLKKDCMEEINLFSENKSHLKQLGEQLLMASDEAKQTQVHGSLHEVHQRWHNLFHHIEARVKKLKETLATVQQLDKNMSNLRSWLSRVEADLSRPVTYSVCHQQEIQKRLAEQQELQRDINQHTEGVASVLSLCDVLLRDEDAAVNAETESDSLQETSRSLDQRWRAICALALDRRLRIEETWRLWCKFLEDYSRFEDWLKMAEVMAANPNSSDVQYTAAREELKKFEGFQRQVQERLTQLELVNNQYRRLARENRTDRASQIRAMVNKGNQRWDVLHRRVAAVLRRLKHFTSQREEFESTRENMLVWLTELDLQLTNVEHFCESDVHHKIQQLSSFQREITLNTERIDGLIVFGEGLIQKSSPDDAALIEEELEELHSYCQEVFSRLVRFHQRLSQPPIREEPELSGFSLESSLELIGRPWLGRSLGSLPATPSHLLTSPLSRSGRETPVSVDSLPLEWDHTGDVGGSSSHEDEEDEDGLDDEGSYFSTLSGPRWRPAGDPDPEREDLPVKSEAPPTLTSMPLKPAYLSLTPGCSLEDLRRVSLALEDREQPEEPGLTGLRASEQTAGVIERWELIQAQSSNQQNSRLTDLDEVTSWLKAAVPELERHLQSDPAHLSALTAAAVDLKEKQRDFSYYKSIMLSLNLRGPSQPGQQERLALVNRAWSRVCAGLQQWDASLRTGLLHCKDFHQSLHSLLLWLDDAESRRRTVDIHQLETPVRALQRHRLTLTDLQGELQERRVQQEALQALWTQLQPEEAADDSEESQEKIHVTGSKVTSLLTHVQDDLQKLRQRLDTANGASPPPSFFSRVLWAALPLHFLLLLLLLLACLLPACLSESGCSDANNFARSFHLMLRYTNGPPPT